MSMRLLVNENFPMPAVKVLRGAGYDVISIAELCPGIVDSEVLAMAVKEQCWLVTFDRDYGELLFAKGHPPPPTVVLFRVQSYQPEEPAKWIMQLDQDESDYLGKFIVYDGVTIRSRPLLR
jgi:predicted nuclease of predicted toxin-antitoxin system